MTNLRWDDVALYLDMPTNYPRIFYPVIETDGVEYVVHCVFNESDFFRLKAVDFGHTVTGKEFALLTFYDNSTMHCNYTERFELLLERGMII